MILKCFLQFCGLPFYFLYGVIWCTVFFFFLWNPIYFFFCHYVFGVIFKKLLLNPRLWRFTPMFSSRNFIVLPLKFQSMSLRFYPFSSFSIILSHYHKSSSGNYSLSPEILQHLAAHLVSTHVPWICPSQCIPSRHNLQDPWVDHLPH